MDKNLFISIIVAFAIGSLLAICYNNFSIAVFAFVSWIAILTVNRIVNKEAETKYVNTLIFAWIIHIICILIVYWAEVSYYGLPYVLSDDWVFDTIHAPDCIEKGYFSINQLLNSDLIFYKLVNCKLYLIFLANVQRIASLMGGYHTIDIRLLNIACIGISAILINKIGITQYKFKYESEKQCMNLMLFLPNIIYLGVHVYRDVYVMLFLSFLFYIWNNDNIKQHKFIILSLTILMFYFLIFTREFASFYGALIVLYGLFSNQKSRLFNNNNNIVRFFTTLLLIGIGCLIAIYNDSINLKIDNYMSHYDEINTESSGFSSIAYSIGLIPFGWLARCFVFLVSPFYPQIVGISVFNGLLDVVYFSLAAGTCVLFWKYPYLLKRIWQLDSLAILTIVIFMSSAIVTSGFRHILMAYPFMFLCIVDQYNKSSPKTIEAYRINSLLFFGVWLLLYTLSRMI